MSQGERLVKQSEYNALVKRVIDLEEQVSGLNDNFQTRLEWLESWEVEVRRNHENRSGDPVETKPSESPIRVQAERGIPDIAARMSFGLGGRESGRPSDYPQPDHTEPAR